MPETSKGGLRIKAEAKTLREALALATGAVPSRTKIPILSCVRLSALEGVIRISGTNLDLMVEADAEADVLGAGEACVEAATLSRALTAMTGEVVAWTDRDRLLVKADIGEVDLPVVPADQWVGLKLQRAQGSLELGPAAFKRALLDVSYCVSREEQRYYLCGVRIVLEADTLRLSATDGHRAADTRMNVISEDGAGFSESLIVPSAAVKELARLCDGASDVVTLTTDGNLVRLEAGACRLTSRLIDGTYPDLDRVMPRAPENEIIADVKELDRAVRFAMTCATGKSNSVKLDPDEAGPAFDLLGSEVETGKARARIGVSAATGGVMGFNGKYLIDALARITGDAVELAHNGSSGPVLITDGDRPLRQVIMQLRV